MRQRKHQLGRLAAWGFALSLALASSAQEIAFSSPAAGDAWQVGATHTVRWTSSGYEGKRLVINYDGLDVADKVPVEDGQFAWAIPWEVAAKTGCTLSISVDGQSKATSGAFSLVANSSPSLRIRAPVGNEGWAAGRSYAVSWEAHNLGGELTLELLKGGTAIDKVDGIPVADIRRSYTLPGTLAVAGDYAIRLSSAAEPALSSTSGLLSVAAQPPEKKKWTVLCYFDGDCNLEGEMLDAFRQMGKLNDCADVNYLFQIDRIPGFNTEFGNWYGTKRFRAGNGVTPEPAYAVQDLGELNMGGAETLTDFINWATENYPADKYFLIISNHGSGWLGDEKPAAGGDGRHDVCEDKTNGGQEISTRATQAALDNATAKMEMIGFDACLEGFIEVAYQLRGCGPKIMVASQYQESSSGEIESASWPYAVIFRRSATG